MLESSVDVVFVLVEEIKSGRSTDFQDIDPKKGEHRDRLETCAYELSTGSASSGAGWTEIVHKDGRTSGSGRRRKEEDHFRGA
mmetsp:Transcript_18278/g.41563  ORF Transcript_18278/g.41563 Transcript_18278/m.41563 type:complete len:83 (+) Transcript_18278:650-898(+)